MDVRSCVGGKRDIKILTLERWEDGREMMW